ncbi:hypothetical protein SEA_MOOSEHEAD_59 [Gordonia phage Moosehead]|nr:hypothetical protein SEA_MOOSEHEAD_59 [Gordonia phage Moosehead]
MTDHTPNLEPILAPVLAEHDHRSHQWPSILCFCGHESTLDNPPEGLDFFERAKLLRRCHAGHVAAHVVAVIRDSGLTVIAPPEADGRWAEGPEWVQGANLADRSGWVAWTAEGAGMVMPQRVEPGELTPDGARELAAALIAASLTAQGDNP